MDEDGVVMCSVPKEGEEVGQVKALHGAGMVLK